MCALQLTIDDSRLGRKLARDTVMKRELWPHLP
jgi:hypothetical protein